MRIESACCLFDVEIEIETLVDCICRVCDCDDDFLICRSTIFSFRCSILCFSCAFSRCWFSFLLLRAVSHAVIILIISFMISRRIFSLRHIIWSWFTSSVVFFFTIVFTFFADLFSDSLRVIIARLIRIDSLSLISFNTVFSFWYTLSVFSLSLVFDCSTRLCASALTSFISMRNSDFIIVFISFTITASTTCILFY